MTTKKPRAGKGSKPRHETLETVANVALSLLAGDVLQPEPESEPTKRGPGRPATGKTTDTRTVTLKLEDWAWVDAQGGSRSHVLAALIAKARRAAKK